MPSDIRDTIWILQRTKTMTLPDTSIVEEVDYKLKYERLKEFIRGKWKGDCAECAAIANEILNRETTGEKL